MPAIENWIKNLSPGNPRVPEDFRERYHRILEKSQAAADRLSIDAGFAKSEIARYRAAAGDIFNSTSARALHKRFAHSPNYRTLYNNALNPYAKTLIYKALCERMTEHSESKTIVILAGGAASGKTSVVRDLIKQKSQRPHALLDVTSKSFDVMRGIIDMALTHDKFVEMYFVYRSIDEAAAASVARALEADASPDSAKTVCPSTLAVGHYSAPRTVRALTQRYAKDDRVSFKLVDNSKTSGKWVRYTKLHTKMLDRLLCGTKRSLILQTRAVTRGVLMRYRDHFRYGIVHAALALAEENFEKHNCVSI